MWVESEVGEGSTFYFTVQATAQVAFEGAQDPAERRAHALAGHHIVGLTANVTEEARRQCLAAGMDTYVSKPVTIDKLKELLRRCTPRALRSEADVANAVSVPTAEPASPARMDDAQIVFWRTQSQERGVELSDMASSIGEEAWKLRSAADLDMDETNLGFTRCIHAYSSTRNRGAQSRASSISTRSCAPTTCRCSGWNRFVSSQLRRE